MPRPAPDGGEGIIMLLDGHRTSNLEKAARLLQEGKLVVFPTDTVYGIGANCFNSDAILKLFEAKQRPLAKGLPILLADHDDIFQVAIDIPAAARELMARFWPGPLTIIVEKKPGLPQALSPNRGIAVRIPDNETARILIRLAGGAVASSSANFAGEPPAATAAELDQNFTSQVDLVIKKDVQGHGRPSTVVDCLVNPPRILRQGPVSLEQLRHTVKEIP